ncbi:MAG: xanthine dehydrogenase family protein subunit M [Methylobacteriaceae bacterium]|nr:xanthine dehydrogenase family protein subunit M [Methylobacteriaceae bacterium]
MLARDLGPDAMFIAGGTDLIIQINRRVNTPRDVIDLSRIAGLSGISHAGGVFRIGALTKHKTVETYPAFGFGTPYAGLREAARVVGGHQIRNQGTVGGNLANASPAADLIPPLLALDAELDLVGPSGTRTLPLNAFFLGPRRSVRAHDEIITEVRFRDLPPLSAIAFLKAGRRKAMEISIISVAARLTLEADGRCRDARIALGAAAPTPIRAREAEALLEGGVPDEGVVAMSARAALTSVSPIDDVRASSEYRRLLVAALVPRALKICIDRIKSARS